MRIYLIAIIESKPQYAEAVKGKLQNLVVQTRHEKACLQYDLHQSLDEPNKFIFYEVWENQEGLDLHNEQPYILDFIKNVPAMLECPPMVQMLK